MVKAWCPNHEVLHTERDGCPFCRREKAGKAMASTRHRLEKPCAICGKVRKFRTEREKYCGPACRKAGENLIKQRYYR